MNLDNVIIVAVALCVLAPIFYFGKQEIRRARKRKKGDYWSIGYQYSEKPLKLKPETAKIYDRSQLPMAAKTLADPFLILHEDKLYLFCEVVLKTSPHGKIGVSVYNQDLEKWRFCDIVLDEPFHLSYPYVFADGSDFYMIPESKQAKSVRLYKATDFPLKWKLEKILINDKKYVDPSILFREDRYYLFVTRKRRLYLYHANALTDEWKLHPRSPVKIWNHARCAGRFFEHDGHLYRFAQEQARGYGNGMHAYKILKLSPTAYKETPIKQNPLLKPFGTGWAAKGMHHLDVLKISDTRFLSVFDGRGTIRQ